MSTPEVSTTSHNGGNFAAYRFIAMKASAGDLALVWWINEKGTMHYLYRDAMHFTSHRPMKEDSEQFRAERVEMNLKSSITRALDPRMKSPGWLSGTVEESLEPGEDYPLIHVLSL